MVVISLCELQHFRSSFSARYKVIFLACFGHLLSEIFWFFCKHRRTGFVLSLKFLNVCKSYRKTLKYQFKKLSENKQMCLIAYPKFLKISFSHVLFSYLLLDHSTWQMISLKALKSQVRSSCGSAKERSFLRSYSSPYILAWFSSVFRRIYTLGPHRQKKFYLRFRVSTFKVLVRASSETWIISELGRVLWIIALTLILRRINEIFFVLRYHKYVQCLFFYRMSWSQVSQ